jgi:hypothetical protein
MITLIKQTEADRIRANRALEILENLIPSTKVRDQQTTNKQTNKQTNKYPMLTITRKAVSPVFRIQTLNFDFLNDTQSTVF